jgi:two-component system sensor histidine kinase PilS (NtrC family)
VNTPFDTRRVLSWIYAGRLVVCLAVFGSALLVGEGWSLSVAEATPQRLVAMLGLGAAAILTPIAYWYSHWRGEPSKSFLLGQAILDTLLVTGIVHLTGGSNSLFPPLFYIAAASGYALLLPFMSAVLVAVFMGVLYMADIAIAYPDQLDIPVIAQIVILTIVASVASLVGAQSRRSREQLRTVQGELRQLRVDTADILRTIISGVVNFDSRGRVAYMNPAAGDLLGLEPEAWLGHDLLTQLHRHAPEVAIAVTETLETGDPIRNREIEVPVQPLRDVQPGSGNGYGPALPAPGAVKLAEGAIVVPLAIGTTALRGPGASQSATLVLQDLRMVRQLEDLRLQTEKLEAVAELSASLAHEIRNPLAAIRSAAEQLAARAREDEDDRLLSQLVVREAERLNRLLAEFSDFARVDISKRKAIDLARLVSDAIGVVRQHPDVTAGAQIESRVEVEVDDLWGDPDLLHRVLVNLILNAAQMGRTYAQLEIQVVVDSLRPALVPAEVALGRPVRIRVIDNGPGIPAQDIDRIFDPFYTRRTGGSGLGLSIAHRAVHAHGGALMATSIPGNGATFVIVLPRRGSAERRVATRDDRGDRRQSGSGSASNEQMPDTGRADSPGKPVLLVSPTDKPGT